MGLTLNVQIVSASNLNGVFPFVVVCFDNNLTAEVHKTSAAYGGPLAVWNDSFTLDLSAHEKKIMDAGGQQPSYLTFFMFDTGVENIPSLGSAGVRLSTVRETGVAKGDFPVINGSGTLALVVETDKDKWYKSNKTKYAATAGAVGVGALAAGLTAMAINNKKKKKEGHRAGEADGEDGESYDEEEDDDEHEGKKKKFSLADNLRAFGDRLTGGGKDKDSDSDDESDDEGQNNGRRQQQRNDRSLPKRTGTGIGAGSSSNRAWHDPDTDGEEDEDDDDDDQYRGRNHAGNTSLRHRSATQAHAQEDQQESMESRVHAQQGYGGAAPEMVRPEEEDDDHDDDEYDHDGYGENEEEYDSRYASTTRRSGGSGGGGHEYDHDGRGHVGNEEDYLPYRNHGRASDQPGEFGGTTYFADGYHSNSDIAARLDE